MKFEITLCDGDSIWDSIREVLNATEDDNSDDIDERHTAAEQWLSQWIPYAESVTIIFDTDNNTAIVKETTIY